MLWCAAGAWLLSPTLRVWGAESAPAHDGVIRPQTSRCTWVATPVIEVLCCASGILNQDDMVDKDVDNRLAHVTLVPLTLSLHANTLVPGTRKRKGRRNDSDPL